MSLALPTRGPLSAVLSDMVPGMVPEPMVPVKLAMLAMSGRWGSRRDDLPVRGEWKRDSVGVDEPACAQDTNKRQIGEEQQPNTQKSHNNTGCLPWPSTPSA